MNLGVEEFYSWMNLLPCGAACFLNNGVMDMLHANAAFFAMTGYTPEELEEITTEEGLRRMAGLDLDDFLRGARRQRQVQGKVRVEFPYVRKNGGAAWCRVTAQEYRLLERGDVWLCLLQDITEEKRSLELLEEERQRNAALLEHASDIFFEYDFEKDMLFPSPRWKEVFGYPLVKAGMDGLLASDMVYRDDKIKVSSLFGRVVSGGPNVPEEIRFRRADGKYLNTRVSVTAVRGKDGRPVKMYGCAHLPDQPEKAQPAPGPEKRQAAVADVTVLANVFELLFGAANTYSAVSLLFTMVGQRFRLRRAYVFEAFLDEDVYRCTCEWCSAGVPSLRKIGEKGYPMNGGKYARFFSPNGVFYCPDVSRLPPGSEPARLAEASGSRSILQCAITGRGGFRGAVGFGETVSGDAWTQEEVNTLALTGRLLSLFISQVRREEELAQRETLLAAVEEDQALWSYVVDPNDHRLLSVGPNLQQRAPQAKRGEICYHALAGAGAPCARCPLQGLGETRENRGLDRFFCRDGQWMSATATAIQWSGAARAVLLCYSDITRFTQKLTERDKLTGALTLERFRLNAEELLAGRPDAAYAMVYADVEKLRYINDSYGYAVGDSILVAVANTISSLLGKEELICRPSSDHFILLLEYATRPRLEKRIETIIGRLEEMRRKQFKSMKLAVAFGVYPIEPGDGISTAVDHANTMRKSIKGAHKSGAAFFDERARARILQEKYIESAMEPAMENGEFVVYLQPKYNIWTRRIMGAEALVRWQHPERGLIPPGEFIPFFERNGFVTTLDFYVFEQVCRLLRRWLDLGLTVVPVSVNLSRMHLAEPGFLFRLKDIADQYQVPHRLLELEMTESTVRVEHIDELRQLMQTMKNMGFLISMDDFGTGYSSLNLLESLPIDVLKLDKDFFQQENTSEREKIVLSSVVDMAKKLEIGVIAEGVETYPQLEVLKEIHCDSVQGFLFARPMPPPQFEQKLCDEEAG